VSKRILRGLMQACVAAVLVGAVTQALALESEEIIKYREAVMKSQAGHMGAIAQIVRGKVDYTQDLKYHAEALKASMDTISNLFPEGSDFGVTRALPAIWEKRPEFDKAAKDAEAAAADFLKAVESGDKSAIGDRFAALADACKGCHKDFREEKE